MDEYDERNDVTDDIYTQDSGRHDDRSRPVVEDVDAIGGGEDAFDSADAVYLKTVRSGSVVWKRIMIKPLPAGEAESLLMDEMPKPPTSRRPAAAGSELAKLAGLPTGGIVLIADMTDKQYQRQNRAWMKRCAYAMLARVIVSPMVNRDGSPAETLNDRINAVERAQFTDEHVRQIMTKARTMTEAKEEEIQAFFGEGSAYAVRPDDS